MAIPGYATPEWTQSAEYKEGYENFLRNRDAYGKFDGIALHYYEASQEYRDARLAFRKRLNDGKTKVSK